MNKTILITLNSITIEIPADYKVSTDNASGISKKTLNGIDHFSADDQISLQKKDFDLYLSKGISPYPKTIKALGTVRAETESVEMHSLEGCAIKKCTALVLTSDRFGGPDRRRCYAIYSVTGNPVILSATIHKNNADEFLKIAATAKSAAVK